MSTDDRTPGQVAYEEWMRSMGRTDAHWHELSAVLHAAWETSARAVVEHHEAGFEEVADP